MGMTDATVLIVDDDPQVLSIYEHYLGDRYTVRTASTGDDAFEQVDNEVDVVLLDRRMPGLSGDEFLDTIREQGYTGRVAIVTAMDPDFDVVELGFDEYIVKPVSKENLLEVVANLVNRANYERHIQEWLALLSKKATLEHEKSTQALERSAEYEGLLQEIDRLNERAEADLKELTPDQYDTLFRQIDPEPEVDI